MIGPFANVSIACVSYCTPVSLAEPVTLPGCQFTFAGNLPLRAWMSSRSNSGFVFFLFSSCRQESEGHGCKRLEKVTVYKDVNRMAAANLAIVFGPTLMWPPVHLTTTNMALNMMQQNMVVEALITNLAMISAQ